MCISIRSILPMSLSPLEIMDSDFLSNLCKANFVSSQILALFTATCLWTWMSLSINIDDLVLGHQLS